MKSLPHDWCDALRSGKYSQAQYVLRDMKDRMCCLGVRCDMHNPSFWKKQVVRDDKYDWTYGDPGADLFEEVQIPRYLLPILDLRDSTGSIAPADFFSSFDSSLMRKVKTLDLATRLRPLGFYRDPTMQIDHYPIFSLAELNDGGYNFFEIATVIEQRWEEL